MIARDFYFIILLFAVPILYLLTIALVTPFGTGRQGGNFQSKIPLMTDPVGCLILLILPIAHLPRIIREWQTEGPLVGPWLACWIVVARCGYVVVRDWGI